MTAYTKLDQEILLQLESLVPGRLISGPNLNADYARDETPLLFEQSPEAVALPGSTDEVSALLRFCNDKRIPVTPRGSGTGLVGGAVAACGGLVLSLENMNRILEFDEKNLKVRVEPGVRIGDLQRACRDRGLFYPPDPAEKLGSLGGNVSTNAGGMRAVRYGVTRDYVMAATAVLPSGEIIRVGANSIKNSSGYGLLHLLIGSEGTLGVITELTLRLLPLPTETISLLAPFASTEGALSAVPSLRRQLLPRSIEFMEAGLVQTAQRHAGQFPYPERIGDVSAGAYLLVTLDGSDADALTGQAENAGAGLLDSGALDMLLADTPNAEKGLFSIREALLDTVKEGAAQVEELDAALPPDQMAAFLDYVHKTGEQYGLQVMAFGHAGDGNLHVYLCTDSGNRDAFSESTEAVMQAAYQKAASLGGMLSGEHGVGFAKKSYLPQFLDETCLTLMRGIKTVFDPNQILNPGKIF